MIKLIRKFLKSQKDKQEKEEFATGFMAIMRLYYIDRKARIEIEEMFPSVDHGVHPFFAKGMDEAWRIIFLAELEI